MSEPRDVTPSGVATPNRWARSLPVVLTAIPARLSSVPLTDLAPHLHGGELHDVDVPLGVPSMMRAPHDRRLRWSCRALPP